MCYVRSSQWCRAFIARAVFCAIPIPCCTTHKRTQTYAHTHMHARTRTHTHTDRLMIVLGHTHTHKGCRCRPADRRCTRGPAQYARMHAHSRLYTCTRTPMQVHEYVRMRTHSRRRSLSVGQKRAFRQPLGKHVYTHVYTHVCTYFCPHVCTHFCTHVCTHA